MTIWRLTKKITEATIPDIKMPGFLPTIDGTYDQLSLENSELPRSYFRDVGSVTGCDSDLTGVNGELDTILITILNRIPTGHCDNCPGSLIIRGMVKGASLSFAVFLFNTSWQTKTGNFRVIAVENIYETLKKKGRGSI
jgi:hypothetical protein